MLLVSESWKLVHSYKLVVCKGMDSPRWVQVGIPMGTDFGYLSTHSRLLQVRHQLVLTLHNHSITIQLLVFLQINNLSISKINLKNNWPWKR